ncbi:putative ABC transport system permease protein [Luteibacter sp. W1I16]
MKRPRHIVYMPRIFPRQSGALLLASLTLAIGVAALVGALTLLDAVLLRPPPWPNHASLAIYGGRTADDPMRAISPRLYSLVGDPSMVLSRGAARMPEAVNVVQGRHRGLLRAQRVDRGFLPTLGVLPALGQRMSFRAGLPEVLLSDALWRRWFGADETAIGRMLTVDGQPMRIRGVLTADYRFFTDVDLVLPSSLSTAAFDTGENMTAIARVPAGSVAALSAHIGNTAARNAANLGLGPADTRWYGATPVDELMARGAGTTIWLSVGCALLVLVVAGMNVSNLMLTRALDRSHETSLLFALGATGWRPWMPALATALAIAVLAAVVGVLAGRVLVAVFHPLVPESWLASAGPLEPGRGVLAVVFVSTLAVASVATVGAAISARAEPALRQHVAVTGHPAGGLAKRRMYSAMTMAQTALATLLLCASAAATLRWWRLDQLPLGFDHSHAMVMEMRAPVASYADREAVDGLLRKLRARALQLPGVETMGWSTQLPVGDGFVMPFLRPGGTVERLQYVVVTPGALESLGLEKTGGRWIDDGDRADAGPVVMVNRAYLEQMDGRGIGGTVHPASGGPVARIVGVVANTALAGLSAPAEPAVFVPLAQVDRASFGIVRQWTSFHAVLRGRNVGPVTGDAFTRIVADVAPSLSPDKGRTLDEVARAASAAPRRDAVLMSLFAAFAVALASVGHYSVQAVDVMSRRRMFALRSALGATPAELMAQVVRRALAWAIPGIAAGLSAAFALHRWLLTAEPFLGMRDPWVIATVAPTMIAATVAAVLLPAWRAGAVEPWGVVRVN